ncbi:MAG: NAD(P)H-dependent oxidoreductase [Alphaproteobacteria bacterium]|nr:NAD(P)H-dependent oxidoreductase [Alphaproteobacteria bacterium]
MGIKQPQKILIIYAHPNLSGSTANQAMIKAAQQVENVTIVDLYAKYPDFKIDIKAEQQLLAAHDILIFQFPLYWYSSPALLKEWQDVVLQHGVNYGSKVNVLTDKIFFCAVTAGVDQQEFLAAGRSLPTILCPFEQTFQYCKLKILPPFLLYDTPHDPTAPEIKQHAVLYAELLIALSTQMLEYSEVQSLESLNILSLPLLQKNPL